MFCLSQCILDRPPVFANLVQKSERLSFLLKGWAQVLALAPRPVLIQRLNYTGNPDNNLESQYSYNHIFVLKSNSKLLSGFPDGLNDLPSIYVYCII
jgi:hypothetical protein